jgi:predicted nucleic acid-binding protein
MTATGRTPLFIDKGAFYARFVENAPRHESAMANFDGIRDGSLSFGPL